MLTIYKNYPARILTGKVTLLDTSGDVKVQGTAMVYKSKQWWRHENDTCGGGVQIEVATLYISRRLPKWWGGYSNSGDRYEC